jgi:ubiquinone/menaquinone biosynthesis C-methylase UbiE
MNSETKAELTKYLRTTYSGVFSEEQVQRHIEDYVEFEFASQMAEWVFSSTDNIERLLDVGCGFGAFVLLCRKRGVDSIGVELAEFEVEYARRRLREERPGDDPEYVYQKGNALELPFSSSYFDVVTLWNVVEHIADERRLLKEIGRVLTPGGDIFIICPNYAAFRKEAHYLIPWIPLLPRVLASPYIRLFGKDPLYFEKNIYCKTNWGVLRSVRHSGLRVEVQGRDSYREKIDNPEKIEGHRKRFLVLLLRKCRMESILNLFIVMKSLRTYARLLNPFKNSIVLHLRKIEEG